MKTAKIEAVEVYSPENVAAARRAAAIAKMEAMVASRVRGERTFSAEKIWAATPTTSRTTVRDGELAFTASAKHEAGVTPEGIAAAAAANFAAGKFSSKRTVVGDKDAALQSDRSLSGQECSVDDRYALAADVLGGFRVAGIVVGIGDVL